MFFIWGSKFRRFWHKTEPCFLFLWRNDSDACNWECKKNHILKSYLNENVPKQQHAIFLKLFKCVKKWRRNSTTTNFWLPFNVRTLDRHFTDCNNLCKDNFHLTDQFYYESLLVIKNKLLYIIILIYSYIDIFLKP